MQYTGNGQPSSQVTLGAEQVKGYFDGPQHCHYTPCIYLFPSATLQIRAQIDNHDENRPK